MRRKTLATRSLRWLTAVAVGGSAFQLTGCDPAVRGALLEGLEQTTSSLSGALISAFFISLEQDAAGSNGGAVTTTGSP